jgi:hypothetical protein
MQKGGKEDALSTCLSMTKTFLSSVVLLHLLLPIIIVIIMIKGSNIFFQEDGQTIQYVSLSLICEMISSHRCNIRKKGVHYKGRDNLVLP